MMPSPRPWVAALVIAAAFGDGRESAAAARAVRVKYVFQPDCYRPSLTSVCDKRRTGMRLDLGPQIAVWVESADGKQFIDTLMVTSATATRGIGNRPGHWSLPSSPKFPYGKRLMALPVWAHARGKIFDPVVMQDGGPEREMWLGFHESISSPDPYFCRPMSSMEIDVDAISCPTTVFNSAKGKRAPMQPKVYYPPRNDLRTFTDRDCDSGGMVATCALSARSYGDLNDLDAVARATPAYGEPYALGIWQVPADLAEGDYALLLEISKEFDNNASHTHPAYTDPNLEDSGLKTNLGQPSVVFRVPFRLDRSAASYAVATDISGYGDWDGATGALHSPDGTISDAPGSGRGRLLAIAQRSPSGGDVVGRLHVTVEVPEVPIPVDAAAPTELPDGGAQDGGAPVVPPDGGGACMAQGASVTALVVPAEQLQAEHAQGQFFEPSSDTFALVERYEGRVWQGADTTPDAFASGIPTEAMLPAAPGSPRSFDIPDLKAKETYTVGVKPVGLCVEGAIQYATFTTPARKFSQLSGCFIATAAFGSSQAAAVQVLRQARDRARAATGLAAAMTAAYERSSPPLAALLRRTDTGRALVREALAPIITAVTAASAAR